MNFPYATSLPSWLALGAGGIVLITIVGLLAYFLWSTLFLWLGTKVACVENTTFGRALKCNAIIWLLTALVGVAFLTVLWLQIDALSVRTPLIVIIAASLAVVGYAAITISFLMSGFEISIGKSIGVWASTIGLNVLVVFAIEFALWVAMMGPLTYALPGWLTSKAAPASVAATDRPVADRGTDSARLAAGARGTDPARAGDRAASRPAPVARTSPKAVASRAGPDRASAVSPN